MYNNSCIGSEICLMPEDQLSDSKLRKFKRIAEEYANEFPVIIDDAAGWRLDLIAISLNDKKNSIRHYENIDL